MVTKIFTSSDVTVFFFTIAERRKNKIIKEALNQLKKNYPYEIQKNNFILEKNKDKNNYICFVKKTPFSNARTISSVLYIKNHFKNYTGVIKNSFPNFTEFVVIESGKILKIVFEDIFQKSKNIRCITEKEILDNYTKDDLLYLSSKRKVFKKIIFATIILFSILFSVLIISFDKMKKIKNIIEEQKKIEIINQEKKVEENKNKDILIALEKEYKILIKNEYSNVYKKICVIYNCIGKKSIVENINIEKDDFSFDLTTTDAIKILSKFEESGNEIKEIKMNRTTIKDGKEHVTYSGTFLNHEIKINPNTSISERIKLYQLEINKIKKRKVIQNDEKLSSYTRIIRNKLHDYNCKELFFQHRSDSGIVILETLIESKSENILQFICNVQNNEENLMEIKSLRIRNISNEKIQASIQFYTGILLKENNAIDSIDLTKDLIDFKVLSSMFINTTSVTKKQKQYYPKYLIKENNKTKPSLIYKNLNYIGQTKSKNCILIILKDFEMNVLYKLPLVAEEEKFDCCIKNENNNYIAKIQGVKYGVVK